VLEDLSEQGIPVVFHLSPNDPTAERRRELVLTALDTLRAGGYELPQTALEVHLPRYHRDIRVQATFDPDGVPVVEITSTATAATDDDFAAGFMAPNRLLITSLVMSLQTPPEHDRTAIFDHLQAPGLGLVLHEMMRWQHWLGQPALYGDLTSTTLRESHLEAVGTVSRYAQKDPHAFVAEHGLGRLLGRPYGDPALEQRLDGLYQALGGPIPAGGGAPVAPPDLTRRQLGALAHAVRRIGGSNFTESEVRSAEAQLAPFDRWRDVADRAQLIVTALNASPAGHGVSRLTAGAGLLPPTRLSAPTGLSRRTPWMPGVGGIAFGGLRQGDGSNAGARGTQ
jgi:hypothetical protein